MKIIVVIIAIVFATNTFAQQLHIGTGPTFYIPYSSQDRATFPSLFLFKINSNNSKYLFGGGQLFATFTKPLNKKVAMQYTASMFKHSFWEVTYFKDINGSSTSTNLQLINNLAINLNATAQYKLPHNFSIGAGIGLLPHMYSYTFIYENKNNNYYRNYGTYGDNKVINPYIPINVKYNYKKIMLAAEYQQALLKSGRLFNGDNANNFGLLNFSASYLIKN